MVLNDIVFRIPRLFETPLIENIPDYIIDANLRANTTQEALPHSGQIAKAHRP
jgi:hypothetical protein